MSFEITFSAERPPTFEELKGKIRELAEENKIDPILGEVLFCLTEMIEEIAQ